MGERICLSSKLGSLSNDVFERRTSTGSGLFSFFDGGFAQIFSQIASITVKKLRNTNFVSSRHVKRENASLPVDVRRSKTPLLKLPNFHALSLSFSRLMMLFVPAISAGSCPNIRLQVVPHNHSNLRTAFSYVERKCSKGCRP